MTAEPASAAPQWVALAAFAQPHGVSGRIKVKSFTDPADDFATHQPLTDATGRVYTLRITGHAQGMAVVEIEGITRREQAELLRGKKIGVARAAMPILKNPNLYYTDDLMGMQVVESSGAVFGQVRSVANYGASDILEITRPDGENALFAFTHRTFPLVDVAARRITIDPPEVLIAKAGTGNSEN